jgi:hypothetical protein
MRWTRRGAQMLLHARCALLNGELGKYTLWSPLNARFRISRLGLLYPCLETRGLNKLYLLAHICRMEK